MKYFLLNSIKRIKQYSQQLDAESVLSNKSWYVFSDTGEKIVFMFRSNAELLIVVNGKVNKGKWELLPNKVLLIDLGSESYLYNSAFVENQLLALNLDGANDCLIMIEEGLKNQLALNSVDKIDKYLENKYIIQPELELRRKKEEEEKIRLEEANRLKLIAEEEQIIRERIERKNEIYKKYRLRFFLLAFALTVIYELIPFLLSSYFNNITYEWLFGLLFIIPIPYNIARIIMIIKYDFDDSYSFSFIHLLFVFFIIAFQMVSVVWIFSRS